MENQLAKIFTSIDEHKEDMVQDLRTFADLEGHFEEKDNVLKARTWLQQQLEKKVLRVDSERLPMTVVVL